MPDSILCDILSSLPTKEVVATSVLSKRWIHLWRSVPSFHFDYVGDLFDCDKDFNDYYDFLESVNSFLLSRNRDQPIHRFRFSCFSNVYDPTDILTSVNAAMSGRVQHMDFSLMSMNVLPSVVFSCKTLVVLKLAFTRVLDIPSVDFPLLKILHLFSVSLSGDLDLSQLLSACPNLEDLEAKDVSCETKGKFNRLPKLVRASIDEHFPLEIVKDVEVLFIDWVMPVRFLCYYFPFLREWGISSVLISICISYR